jgi:hypothetical protein
MRPRRVVVGGPGIDDLAGLIEISEWNGITIFSRLLKNQVTGLTLERVFDS